MTRQGGWKSFVAALWLLLAGAALPAGAQTAPANPAPGTSATPQNAPAAGTQAPQPGSAAVAEDNGAYTITTVVNEVNLIFTVTDKHGHFIRNLKENDFTLLDDRMPPAEVYSFTQQTNLPLRVGLMIDTSSSIRSRFQFEQNAATEFLLSVLRPKVDQAFVMGFDVTPQITQAYTNNGDLLSAGGMFQFKIGERSQALVRAEFRYKSISGRPWRVEVFLTGGLSYQTEVFDQAAS